MTDERLIRLQMDALRPGHDAGMFRAELEAELPYLNADAVTVGSEGDRLIVKVEDDLEPEAWVRLRVDLGCLVAAHDPGRPDGARERFVEARAQQSATMERVGGVTEAAAILGVSKQTVSERAGSANFPPPIARVAGRRPVWWLDDIERLAAERNGALTHA